MKTEQKQLLNEFCESNGLKVLREGNNHVIVGVEIDEWEGVRFAKCVNVGFYIDKFTNGKIYRLRDGKNINDHYAFIDDQENVNGFSPKNKDHFNPSTEEVYKQQLIKEAKEIYGEIKEGDRFLEPDGLNSKRYACKDDGHEYDYYSDDDDLYYRGVMLYSKGKWAEWVEKEPITIKNIEVGSNTIKFEINREYINPKSEGPTANQDFLKAIEEVCKEYLR